MPPKKGKSKPEKGGGKGDKGKGKGEKEEVGDCFEGRLSRSLDGLRVSAI
jgi:hypothetical protein